MIVALSNIGSLVILAIAVGVVIEEFDRDGARIIAALRGRSKP